MPLIETIGSGSAKAFGLNSFKLLKVPYDNVADAASDGVVMYFPAAFTGDTTSRIGTSTATLTGVSSVSNSALGGYGWDRGTSFGNAVLLNSVPISSYSTSYTFSFWFKPTDMTIHSINDGAGIMWSDDSTQNAASVMWGYDGGSSPTNANETRNFWFGGPGWVNDGTQFGTISVNTWYNLLYTRSGNVWTAYVNGTQVAQRTESYTVANNLWFCNYSLHGGNTNNHYGRGVLDEFIMWNRPLTSSEISNYYSKASTNGLITSIGRI